jgi:gliding motility-associated-like protein
MGTVSCNGGSNGFINTNIIGGTPPYTIAWASSSSVTPGPNMVATNLPTGTYSLTALDMQGCSTSSVYILGEPTQLVTLSSATLPATCGNANGSATVSIGGGTLPYNFNWNTPNLQTGNVASGLNAGNWILTTTDANNCMITSSVTVIAPPLPTATLGATNPLCFGQSNGSAWVTPTGVAPFTYQWSPGSLTSQTITGINAGVYTATVTDNYGCFVFGNINIVQPNVLTLNTSQPDTICFGQFTQIYAAGAGGTTPYTYNWTAPGGVITSTNGGPHPISPTVTSVYTVSLTDANGCFVSPKLINVKVHPQLMATGFSLTRCDNALATLSPDITSAGNGGPYSYNWSNGATTQSITVPAKFTPVNPNIYTVSISDGCTMPGAEASFTINVNPTPKGTFTSNLIKGCAPLVINFNATSDGSSDVFQWNFGEAGEPLGNNANQNIIYAIPGAYTVGLTITNQFGCKKDTLVPDYINAYPVPIADFDPVPGTVNLLEPVINFTNYSTGATSFFWDFGDYSSKDNTSGLINPQHTYSYIGTYDVHLVAINGYGCKDTLRKPIEVKPDMAVYIPNAFTPDGNNINEEFKPKGYGIKDEPYKMEIFDRWGELLFTSENFNKGWNGTVKGTNVVAQEGVYVYKVMVMDFEGNKKYFVGHVTLLKQ